MFPACAGMNRRKYEQDIAAQDVPRVRGDEPQLRLNEAIDRLCSPRARG